jgi:hypothetical protein
MISILTSFSGLSMKCSPNDELMIGLPTSRGGEKNLMAALIREDEHLPFDPDVAS